MSKKSEIYRVVWETVSQIPEGKVATYGDIAGLCDLYSQARLVGYALHNLPPGAKVPWYRVINAQGKISFPKASGNYRSQKKLLTKEGIIFIKDKIDLNKYGWPFRSERRQLCRLSSGRYPPGSQCGYRT